jgi:hypothetical protein
MNQGVSMYRLWVIGLVVMFGGFEGAASAQSVPGDVGQCILAGRISGFGRWAPRLTHLELLDAKGAQILDESSEALAGVTQVRLGAPTLLVVCHRNKSATKADVGDTVPAISAGPESLVVKTLSLVPVGIGGHWVELELVSAQPRVIRIAPPAN